MTDSYVTMKFPLSMVPSMAALSHCSKYAMRYLV